MSSPKTEHIENEPNEEDDEWASWSDEEESTNKSSENVQGEILNKQTSTIVQADSTTEKSAWASWKPWGGGSLASVLSSATESLGNITTTVSTGLNTVMGVPEPEELARINSKIEGEANTDENVETLLKTDAPHNDIEDTAHPVFGLNLVTSLGAKVLSTGLGTLEGIGKKTMDILQENDPLLMNKRKMLGLEPDRPNLSEILKEAKADADELEDTIKALKIEKSKKLLCFDVLFENNCGLVHIEALEILSNECTLRIQNLLSGVSGKALTELDETLYEVKELLELDSLDVNDTDGKYNGEELSLLLSTAIEDADLQINFEDIVSLWIKVLNWLENAETADEDEIFAQGITALAETCALAVNKLHKMGELLLVREHHSTANEIDSLVQLCTQFMKHLNGLTQRFASTLSLRKDSETAQLHIGTLFSELLVAIQQIEKSFKFFIPILQMGAV